MKPLLMLDLDDTLVVRPPIFRAWAEDFIDAHDLPVDADWLAELDGGGTGDRERMHSELAGVGYPGTLEQVRTISEEVASRYLVTDAAWAALDAARAAGWLLAVVTNGPVERQSLKLRVTGLADYVDAVCISEEVGVAKPDPLIFHTAASRAGTTLDGAWMIGDNPGADIAGARAVGIRSVLVERDDAWIPSADVEIDLTAVDLADAVRQILESGQSDR